MTCGYVVLDLCEFVRVMAKPSRPRRRIGTTTRSSGRPGTPTGAIPAGSHQEHKRTLTRRWEHRMGANWEPPDAFNRTQRLPTVHTGTHTTCRRQVSAGQDPF
ncbi:hypothetical protein [Alloactinosynnema sp. L-07]|nr:hypothetical protein [Alloactinosynnema sp. L-07]